MKAQLELPLMPEVTLDILFEDLFDPRCDERTLRDRWARWIKIARKRKRSRDAVHGWMDPEACIECKHRRGRAWCSNMGLPVTVNPYLSFRTGAIGMACYGAGFKHKEGA